MTKVGAPLLSARATGAIGKKVVYFRRRGINIARRYHVYPKYAPEIVPEVEKVLKYVATLKGPYQPVFNNTWFDLNLSAVVPVGTKAVEMLVTATAVVSAGVRPNGSTLARACVIGVAGGQVSVTMQCELAADRIIEIMSSNKPQTWFYLWGYWIPE
jgi:hypothetical protein